MVWKTANPPYDKQHTQWRVRYTHTHTFNSNPYLPSFLCSLRLLPLCALTLPLFLHNLLFFCLTLSSFVYPSLVAYGEWAGGRQRCHRGLQRVSSDAQVLCYHISHTTVSHSLLHLLHNSAKPKPYPISHTTLPHAITPSPRTPLVLDRNEINVKWVSMSEWLLIGKPNCKGNSTDAFILYGKLMRADK